MTLIENFMTTIGTYFCRERLSVSGGGRGYTKCIHVHVCIWLVVLEINMTHTCTCMYMYSNRAPTHVLYTDEFMCTCIYAKLYFLQMYCSNICHTWRRSTSATIVLAPPLAPPPHLPSLVASTLPSSLSQLVM